MTYQALHDHSHPHYAQIVQYRLDAVQMEEPWRLWQYIPLYGYDDEWTDCFDAPDWNLTRGWRRKVAP